MNRSVANPDFPLRRKTICDVCVTSITGSKSKGKYPYYHHHRQDCPKAKFIPKDVFEQQFVRFLDEITPDKKYEKLFKAIVVDIWQNNYKKLNENNKRVRIELEQFEQERLKIFDMHRAVKYTDDEFIEQKQIINNKIYEKQRLIEDNHIIEFNMEEALSHCFNFVRETSKTWIRLKNTNYDHLVRFQNQIFPEKIIFDGEKFGTTKLGLVYKLNKENEDNKSGLVTPQRIEL